MATRGGWMGAVKFLVKLLAAVLKSPPNTSVFSKLNTQVNWWREYLERLLGKPSQQTEHDSEFKWRNRRRSKIQDQKFAWKFWTWTTRKESTRQSSSEETADEAKFRTRNLPGNFGPEQHGKRAHGGSACCCPCALHQLQENQTKLETTNHYLESNDCLTIAWKWHLWKLDFHLHTDSVLA
jgi:hypothetical protein